MTEAEWNSCTEPQIMLRLLRYSGTASERKLRLFAVACCRRIWHLLPDQECREAVRVAESFAEGKATTEVLREVEGAGASYYDYREDVPQERLAYHAGGAIFQLGQEALASDMVANAASGAVACSALDAGGDRRAADVSRHGESAAQCCLLRDIVGNPFRAAHLDLVWLCWSGGLIPKLAQAAYDERRLPEGTLDNSQLAVLADALEDAGCADAELLAHLRSPAVHVRGCFAVDLLLGRN
jgi:hypothetical protein